MTKNYIKALFLAPLAAPAAYFLLLPIFIAFAPKEIMTHYAGLIFYGAYALPMAYIGSILIALPAIIVMKQSNTIHIVSLIITGFILGGVFFNFIISALLHYSPSNISWFFVSGGIMGSSVAYLFAVIINIIKPDTK